MDDSESHLENVGDPELEYTAARTGAVTCELAGWTQVDLTGADRARFLHNFCTNDVRDLSTGNGCEAFITNVQGKVLAHVFVYAASDSLHLIAAPNCGQTIIRHLSRYQINEVVDFADRTADLGLLLITGPQAAIALFNLGSGALSLAQGQHCACSIGPMRFIVCRNDLLGLPGFLLWCPVEKVAELRDRLDTAGAGEAGQNVFQSLRLEAPFPLYGIDITDANLAPEVNRTAQAISFSKGCYLGQEPIARIDALGHVNQQLRGIRLREGQPPAAGAEIVTTDAEPRPIGRVTSAALSYSTHHPVALAYLKRHFDTPGLEVAVAVEGDHVRGEVV